MRPAKLLHAIWNDQSGATAVEYGLIVGLLAATILSALEVIGGNLSGTFTTIASAISGTA